eukprot:2717579-Pyramimonas_sp.AAC.1
MFAVRGIVAGCPFTITFIRINSLDGVDSIARHPCLRVSLPRQRARMAAVALLFLALASSPRCRSE